MVVYPQRSVTSTFDAGRDACDRFPVIRGVDTDKIHAPTLWHECTEFHDVPPVVSDVEQPYRGLPVAAGVYRWTLKVNRNSIAE
jgi:hypothetical protein